MPNLDALWSEPFPIPAHALMALAAFAIGIVQVAGPKGTRSHRALGYAWAALMTGTAVSAVFIHTLNIWGPFSPIHLLIPVTLLTLWLGVRSARRGDVRRHKRSMLLLFWLALVITGFFTLLPGRAMNGVLFGTG